MSVRLNLGGGDDRRPGYWTVDLRSDVADLVADATRLPIADGVADEVLALDLLEHFPTFRTQDILGEWSRVLKAGGRLILKVPNLAELSRWIVDGKSPRLIIQNIYGGHRWGPDGAWDAHHTGFIPDTIAEELRQAGFRLIKNDLALNMRVEAVKGWQQDLTL